MQDWKMTDDVARVEIDRRNKTDEKWRTDIDGPEFAGLEMTDWKLTDVQVDHHSAAR